jgi:predicted nucleic acid-binding protein
MKRGVGVDTCVVLRLLTGVPEAQFARACSFLGECQHRGEPVLVSDLVVSEVYHALLYYYDVPKRVALDSLRSFLCSPGVRCTGYAGEILKEYRGLGAGLVDRLIRAELLAQAERLVSFDKDFCRLGGVQAL